MNYFVKRPHSPHCLCHALRSHGLRGLHPTANTLRSLRHDGPKATTTTALDTLMSGLTDFAVERVTLCFAADIESIRRQAVSKSIGL